MEVLPHLEILLQAIKIIQVVVHLVVLAVIMEVVLQNLQMVQVIQVVVHQIVVHHQQVEVLPHHILILRLAIVENG